MATLIQNLQTRQAAIGVELAALSATVAGGKPDAGKSGIQHMAYKKSLYDELAQIEAAITQAQTSSNIADGGGITYSVGIT